MTNLSGWCIDAQQAMDLDMPALARLRHRKCRPDNCTCKCHNSEETPST